MKIINLTDDIIEVVFEKQKDLARSFCRFQEYYESPVFRGKIFTLGEFRSWYVKTYGTWSYYYDWSGFNVPDYIFVPFAKGLFDPLDEYESNLLNLFKYRENAFYVIGTTENNKEAIGHEICHALWHLDLDYCTEASYVIDTMINDVNCDKIKNWLLRKGYSKHLIKDELNAYLAHSTEKCKQIFNELPKGYEKLVKLKEEVFEKYNLGEYNAK